VDLEVIVHCVEGVTNKFADIDGHLRRPGEYSAHCTSPLIPIRHSQINAASLRLTLTIPKQYKGPFKTPDPPRDFLSVSLNELAMEWILGSICTSQFKEPFCSEPARNQVSPRLRTDIKPSHWIDIRDAHLFQEIVVLD
jgi:hypothetical protein